MLKFIPRDDVTSWGRVVRRRQMVASPEFASELLAWAALDKGPRLAAGLRRSYGDTGLFSDGRMILTPRLDRLLSFDKTTGIVKAQAGLSLSTLLQIVVPSGWFVPVTPGTRWVTLGGAVANDVHGKNHTNAGSIGLYIKGMTLLRSDRGLIEVTIQQEQDLFAATLGGLGLTGIIVDVTLQLAPISSAYLDVETIPLGNLADFFALNKESLTRFEQTVAWLDCTKQDSEIGIGVYTRANWSLEGGLDVNPDRAKTIPIEAPKFALNPISLAVFNKAYRAIQLSKPRCLRSHYSKVFYPLDSLNNWNKLYGSAGFYQYQCVVPPEVGQGALHEMLNIISRSGEGSALVVLKTFGDLSSLGLMSFPRPGYTLALDFQNRGTLTDGLLAQLDRVVQNAGGRLYPAKDGRMPRTMLEMGYPHLDRFLSLRDPACGSDFLKRMVL